MSNAQYYKERVPYEKVSRARIEGIRKLLPDKRPLKVLDVGCGTGVLGAALKEQEGVAVYGIDVSEPAVVEAKKVLDGAWVYDITSGTISDTMSADYDVIVSSEVIEHLFNPEDLITFLSPLLDKGVPLIITTPNILFWKNRLRMLFGKFEYTEDGLMDRGHVHFFSWQALQVFFKSHGYTIVRTAHVIPTRLLKPLGRLIPGFAAYQFCILVQKK